MYSRHLCDTAPPFKIALRHGKRRALVLGALMALGTAVAAARAEDSGFPSPSGDPSVLPSGAKLDRVFDGGCRLTEGVATGPDGMVYFSDITFTKFCKDPSGKYLFAAGEVRCLAMPAVLGAQLRPAPDSLTARTATSVYRRAAAAAWPPRPPPAQSGTGPAAP